MKSWTAFICSLAWLLLFAAMAAAQSISPDLYASNNEAVGRTTEGKRVVEPPPQLVSKSGKPLPRVLAVLRAQDATFVFMIETADRLVECSHAELRPDECQPSTIGAEVRSRTWIVKRRGRWWECAGPSHDAECIDPPAYNGGRGTASLRLPAVAL